MLRGNYSDLATSGKEFVVTFDEPENHLHPELQVRLLPGLIDAFPTAQFVVATHNPLVVSSSPDSQVIVLRYNRQHKVDSEELDFVDKKRRPANDILRDTIWSSIFDASLGCGPPNKDLGKIQVAPVLPSIPSNGIPTRNDSKEVEASGGSLLRR